MTSAVRRSARKRRKSVLLLNQSIQNDVRSNRRRAGKIEEHRAPTVQEGGGLLNRYSVAVSRIRTRQELSYGYTRFKTGDIVRVRDSEEECTYFAQISTLITDDYARHYAIVVWLLPRPRASLTREVGNPKQFRFDPAHFLHGQAETKPVPIEACEWECSCPPIAPYRKQQWTPYALFLDKIREELCFRMQNARKMLH